MKMTTLVAKLGAVSLLLSAACTVASTDQADAQAADPAELLGSAQQALQKSDSRKIYVHMMPWFETPGYHWDNVGRHYNPQIGPYHSGDYKVIEYQLLLMKYAGIDGVILDWPGRSTMHADLPVNAENTDQIIDQTAKFGLEFAVCFEDQYAGDVNDAINSMHWVRDHYFNRPNHIKIDGAPALFVFGPQKIAAGDWPAVLGATGTDPAFFSLWYNNGAGGARDGTYAWIYSDALTGVRNYYDRTDQGSKIGVLYPGFNAAYPNGAPGWGVGYDLMGDTFTALYNLSKGVGQAVQIATWNDYTEGTMIEPTNEFGYKYLTTLQKLLGVTYGQGELEIVRQLYDKRKANDPKAEAASQALIKLDVAGACAQLGCTAPVHNNGGGGSSNGSAGTGSGTAGSQTMTGTAGTATNNGAGTGNGVAGTASGGSAPSGGGGAPGAGTGTDFGGDAPVDTGGTKKKQKDNSGCSLQPAGSSSNAAYFAAALALGAVVRRRRRAA